MMILEVFDLLNAPSADGAPLGSAIACLALSLAARWFGHDVPTSIGDEQRRVGMAQLVEPDPGAIGVGDGAGEQLAEQLR